MDRRILILLAVLIFLTPVCFSQNTENDNRLRNIVGKYGQAEVTIPYKDNKTLSDLTSEVSIISVKDHKVLINLSPITVEWFIRQNLDYNIIDRDETKGIVSALNITEAMDWESYPTYTQYDSIMQHFNSTYPDLCRLDTIGTSINGRLVLAVKISDNVTVNESEPEVFYSSTIHGDELAGYVLMLRLADYLLSNYATSSRVKNLVDNLEIWINPLANPDGTYRTGDLITTPTRFNANGVDLNRNFPDPFQPLEIQEKENADMIKFMRKHKFSISANFHSGFEIVNYPWDRWLSKTHADDQWFNSICRAYADTVHTYSVAAYMNSYDNGVVRGAVWYIIYGGRQDFVTWELQGREVTIELDNVKETPAAQLELLWQYNRRSFITYFENALYGIHGQVRNANTLVPVAAKVSITGHDIDSSHVYSDTASGSFVRLLYPGIWDLTFSASGYYDTTITGISTFEGQRTDIIVDLVPKITGIDTIITGSPLLYPNPARRELNAILPESLIGSVNIKIFNQLGKLVSEYDTEVSEGVPLPVNIKYFSPGTYSIMFTGTVTGTISRGRIIVVK